MGLKAARLAIDLVDAGDVIIHLFRPRFGNLSIGKNVDDQDDGEVITVHTA